jgi:heat-inducible transcriptional repressor
MDSRKRKILQAITDDYIASAEPVGSRTIAHKYHLGVSPATIRNEMADLEEMGYLEQPHTSAGRIPSDKGYRFYVDSLMNRKGITYDEVRVFHTELEKAVDSTLEEIIQCCARILAALTQYTTIAIGPTPADFICRHVRLVPLDQEHILAVLITDPGYMHNQIIEVPGGINQFDIDQLNMLLKECLQGISLKDVSQTPLQSIGYVLAPRIIQLLLDDLFRKIDRSSNIVFLEGTRNILEHPEFKDVDRAKSLLGLLEEKGSISEILGHLTSHNGISVTIGQENTLEEMRECSVVTATYGIGGQVYGILGLLGPTRMDYSRVYGTLDYMVRVLNDLLTDHFAR